MGGNNLVAADLNAGNTQHRGFLFPHFLFPRLNAFFLLLGMYPACAMLLWSLLLRTWPDVGWFAIVGRSPGPE